MEMANPARDSPLWKPVQELTYGLLGVLLFCAMAYFLMGLLLRVEFLKSYSHGISLFRFWSVLVMAGFAGAGQVLIFVEQFRKINASEQVAAAIGDIKDKDPAKSISEITVDDVAASLKG